MRSTVLNLPLETLAFGTLLKECSDFAACHFVPGHFALGGCVEASNVGVALLECLFWVKTKLL
jgi:hypothetical protein